MADEREPRELPIRSDEVRAIDLKRVQCVEASIICEIRGLDFAEVVLIELNQVVQRLSISRLHHHEIDCGGDVTIPGHFVAYLSKHLKAQFAVRRCPANPTPRAPE